MSAVETAAVITGVGASLVFGTAGYFTGVVLRRRHVLDTATAHSEAEAGRVAAELVGTRIAVEMASQFKTISDHLIFQDRRIQFQGERLARIEGKLGLPPVREPP